MFRISVRVAWVLFIGGFVATLGVVLFASPATVRLGMLYLSLTLMPCAAGASVLMQNYGRKR